MLVRKTILVVDDDKTISGLLRDMLESDGFEVRCCNNGRSALELSKERCFDVIVADYHMPGGNGADIVRSFRCRCSDALIVGLSAEPKGEEFKEAGADIFFKKPCLFRELLAIIHERQPPGCPGLPKS